MKDVLSKLIALLRSNNGQTEATDLPFWYIAVSGGAAFRRPVMVSQGFWFSREAAAAHLKAKAHRYPNKAFVYCDSGYGSTHVARLYEILKEAEVAAKEGVNDSNYWKAEGYQYLLGRFADALGATGSVDFETVLQKARNLREFADSKGICPFCHVEQCGKGVFPIKCRDREREEARSKQ